MRLKEGSLSVLWGYFLLITLFAFLVFAPWFYGLTRFKDQLLTEIFVFLLFLLSAPFIQFEPAFEWNPRRIHFWIVIALAVSSFSIFFSAIPYQSLLSFLRFLSVVLVYFLVRLSVTNDRRCYLFLGVIFMAGAAYAIYGILQYYGFLPKDFWYQPNSLASRLVNGGHFGAFLLFPLWLAVSLFIRNKNWLVRIAILFLSIFCLWALILTRARTVWLAFVLGSFFFIGFASQFKVSKIKVLTVIFICGALGGLILLKLGVLKDAADRIQEIWAFKFYSLNYRGSLWVGSLKAIAARPWGWGVGTFGLVFPLYRINADRFVIDYAHNEFFQVGVDLGVTGIVLLLGFIFFYFFQAVRLLKNKEAGFYKTFTAVCFLALWSGLLISSQTDFPLRIYAISFFFAAFLALSSYLFDSKNPEQPASSRKGSIQSGAPPLFFKAIFLTSLLVFCVVSARQLLAEIAFQKAQAFEDNIEWNKAQQSYEKAIRLAPLYGPYAEALANLFQRKSTLPFNPEMKKQYRKKAIEIYTRGTRLQPLQAEIHHRLAQLYEGEGDLEQTKVELKKAMDLEPQNSYYPREYGYFAIRHGLVDDAIAGFERFKKIPFLTVEGQESDICFILQACYSVTQDYDKLQKLISDSQSHHYCFGRLLGEKGRWPEAKKEFEQMRVGAQKELAKESFTNLIKWLGDFYAMNQQFQAALEVYDSLLRKNPDDLQIQKLVKGLSEKLSSAQTSAMPS